MKKVTLFFVALFCAVMVNATEGALPGLFSVSATTRVQFSQGNLQYQASTSTFRFATSQLDYIGESNSNISSSYFGWIDLFGWGTGYNPTLSSSANADYSTFTDWGVNAISNGGNKANQWHTLTQKEWAYLFTGRTNAQALFGLGSVNGINGVIILPDDWTLPSGLVFYASSSKGLSWQLGNYFYDSTPGNHFSDNAYSSSEWSRMEAAGAVFLPAAGDRNGKAVYNVGQIGEYWSAATYYDEEHAYGLNFSSRGLSPKSDFSRQYGKSVRLVTVEKCKISFAVDGVTKASFLLEAGSPKSAVEDLAELFLEQVSIPNDREFKYWDPELAAVTKDQTYNAVLDYINQNYYTISFVVNGDTVLAVDLKYGTEDIVVEEYANTAAEIAVYPEGQTFKDWDKYFNKVTEDETYTAILRPIGQGIDQITNDKSPITNKTIKDGQLFIERNGKTYNALGAEIK